VHRVIQPEQGIDRKGSRWLLVDRRVSIADPETDRNRNDVRWVPGRPTDPTSFLVLSHQLPEQSHIALRHKQALSRTPSWKIRPLSLDAAPGTTIRAGYGRRI
jgi:hypothetical protein